MSNKAGLLSLVTAGLQGFRTVKPYLSRQNQLSSRGGPASNLSTVTNLIQVFNNLEEKLLFEVTSMSKEQQNQKTKFKG